MSVCLVILAAPARAQLFQQQLPGSVARSIQSKLADVVNVRDFGAVCDGVTDDAPAFQMAASAVPYGTIHIPPGACFLNANINVAKDNIKFRGSGQGATLLIMGPAVTRLFNVTNNSTTQLVLPEFSDFMVDGSRAPGAAAFYISGARSVHIERIYTVRCYISYFVDRGAQVTSTFHLSAFMIEDTPDLPGARGILLNGGGDDWFISDGRLFEDAQAQNNVGVELRSGGGFMLDRIDISSFGRALLADPPAGAFVRFGQFNAVQCDTSWGDNAVLDGSAAAASGYPNGVYDLHFVNSWFSSAGVNGGNGNGLNIVSAQGIVVEASQIYSNSLNGVRLQAGAHDIVIAHSQISSNSNGFGNGGANTGVYSGVAVDANVVGFTLDGNKSGAEGYNPNNQKYGIVIGRNCRYYRVIGNDASNNLRGAYNDLSAGASTESQILGNLPSSINSAVAGSLFVRGAVGAVAFQSTGSDFRSLGAPPDGTLLYCRDCSAAPACSPGGHGAFARRVNRKWLCN